jgi:succinate dehydrogenase / fumarate reductase cytochrome b subunit
MSTPSILGSRFSTTVAKELIVGVTGVLLVGFILMHLMGNLLILIGPGAFNDYAEKLHNLGKLVWLARIGLIVTFVAHISMAISLARANAAARGGQRYEVEKTTGRKSAGTRLMLLSGIAILCFVLFHVYDFTITGDRTGDRSFVEGMGDASMGLYGVVFNSFANPVRSLFYIIAVCAVGLHLSHAIASVVVTLGFLADKSTDRAEFAAKAIGLIVALGFSSIPLYVFIRAHVIGV